MRITLDIPDEFAATLTPRGEDPSRAALEAYRERRLSGYQVRSLLGIPSRYEFDAFLKSHRVEKYTAEDFEHDLATIRQTERLPQPERGA